ncbi:MAG: sugar-binding protein [Eubacteriales bacterium]
MKKIFTALILAAALTVSSAVVTGAAATENEERSIPKAAVAPTIDGVITEDEWANALAIKVNADTTNAVAGSLDTCPDATYYWMWDDAGIYFFGDVKDETENGAVHTYGEGSYNSGDGIQFCIYPDTTMTGSTAFTLYFWSLVVCADGEVGVGEHFTFGTGSQGFDVPEVKAACTKTGNSYTIEAFLPAEVWTDSIPPLEIAEGTTFSMANVLMEHDGITQSLMSDTAWFDGANSNKYTLTNDVAGHVDAPETEPETEPAPVAEPETEPEAPAETEPAETEPVEEPKAAETVTTAPQTFDIGVISAVAAIISLAGFASFRKK